MVILENMKKFIILAALMLAGACVGQKDDPEELPDGPAKPDTPAVVSGTCLLLDFTGTWCVNCPRMETAIEEAMEQHPGLIVPVSVHCLNLDPLAVLPLSSDLAARFGVTGYPSVVIDLEKGSLFSATSADLIVSRCNSALAARGKAAKLTVELSGTTASVTAKVNQKGNYTLHMLVLEDGVVAPQTGGSEQHVHNNVLRSWIDSEEYKGLGTWDEIMFARGVILGENQRIVAFACRDGIVNSVVQYP